MRTFVSRKTPACPGDLSWLGQNSQFGEHIVKSLATIAALALAVLTAGCQTNAQTPPPVSRAAALSDNELRDLTEDEKKLITPALAKGLKDPESANSVGPKCRNKCHRRNFIIAAW
jgi:hypothetical protein